MDLGKSDKDSSEDRVGTWVIGPNWYILGPGIAALRSPYPDLHTYKQESFHFTCGFLSMFDWDRYMKAIWQGVVYCSRYGSDSIETMLDWDVSRILRVVYLLADIVKQENGSD